MISSGLRCLRTLQFLKTMCITFLPIRNHPLFYIYENFVEKIRKLFEVSTIRVYDFCEMSLSFFLLLGLFSICSVVYAAFSQFIYALYLRIKVNNSDGIYYCAKYVYFLLVLSKMADNRSNSGP